MSNNNISQMSIPLKNLKKSIRASIDDPFVSGFTLRFNTITLKWIVQVYGAWNGKEWESDEYEGIDVSSLLEIARTTAEE